MEQLYEYVSVGLCCQVSELLTVVGRGVLCRALVVMERLQNPPKGRIGKYKVGSLLVTALVWYLRVVPLHAWVAADRI